MSRTSTRNVRSGQTESMATETETTERREPCVSEKEESIADGACMGDAGSFQEAHASLNVDVPVMNDDCVAAQICDCSDQEDAGRRAVSFPEEKDESRAAFGREETGQNAVASVPGELDMLRGELLSEELEQNAVEQMFQWERRERRKGDEEGDVRAEEGELSGQALLEAVHHGRYVARLAVDLFEAFADVLSLDERWARLLVQAALWHDLGFAVAGRRRHHKIGMDIVERNPELTLSFGLEETDRPLVALLVRYHRRAWPSMKHRRFAALCREDRRSLAGAAAVLRMADGLDYRHKGAVEELCVTMRRRSVGIECFGAGSCRKECRRALKKGDLFEKLSGRKLEVSQGKEGDRHVC